MASPVTPCTRFAELGSTWNVFKILGPNTTFEALQEAAAKVRDYNLALGDSSYGLTALHLAAAHNNGALVRAILARRPEILELGDRAGYTSLSFVAAKAKRVGVETLLALGASVNTATTAEYRLIGTPRSTPAGATPLWMVLELGFQDDRVNRVAIASLLLLNGAVAQPELSPNGEAMLAEAGAAVALQRTLRAIPHPAFTGDVTRLVEDYDTRGPAEAADPFETYSPA